MNWSLQSVSFLVLIESVTSSLVFNAPVVVTTNKSFVSTDPEWVTSPFFRAGDESVISTLTGNDKKPTHTFTYSSALPGVPNLAYGIKRYRGNDYLGQEYFEIKKEALTATSFTVSIQIYGVTNIHILAVAYLAIDPTFPHHLNSFDNVPLNYSSGPLVNITARTNTLKYFTEVINYTEQASDRQFKTFTTPLTSNYVVLYMTSLWIAGSFYGPYPIKFHVGTQILNSSHYLWNVTLEIQVMVTNVHFSQVIFNSDDVQSSQKYFIVFATWDNDIDGGFIEIPYEFVDNFIMGVTAFETVDGRCGYEYQWEFANGTVNGATTFGVQMLRSWTLHGSCGFSWSRSSIFYMKTWQCPQNYTFFNLSTNLCQDFCGGYYYQNDTSGNCDECHNNNCYQCEQTDDRTQCTQCLAADFFEMENGKCVCMQGYVEVNETCTTCAQLSVGCYNCSYGEDPDQPLNMAQFECLQCNQTANYFVNSTKVCQLCSISFCDDCLNLTVCDVCASTYNLSSAGLCIKCSVNGCLYCQPTNQNKCEVCEQSIGYYLDSSNQCYAICGDGLISREQACDDNNTASHDGCSSTCTVQTSFSCEGIPSNCTFTPNATFVVDQMYMSTTICNILTLVFEPQPTSSVFDRSDAVWDGFITTSNASMIALKENITSYTGGKVTMSYFLNATVQGQDLDFTANFTSLLPNTTLFAHVGEVTITKTIAASGSTKALSQCCPGYSVNNSALTCDEICGDGMLFDMECDDNNTDSYDGCSSNCTVEDPYVCAGGNNHTKSTCTFAGDVVVSFEAANKLKGKNQFTLNVTLQPITPVLNIISNSHDFTQYLSFGTAPITVLNATYDSATNRVMMEASISDTVQGQNVTLQFVPPDIPAAALIGNISGTWVATSDNELSLIYYTDEEYARIEILEQVTTVVNYGYLGVMIGASFYRKWIGLQFAALVQLGYLSLIPMDKTTQFLLPISDMKYLFGYNSYHPTESTSTYTSEYTDAGFYQDTGYTFNAMFITMLGFYLIGLMTCCTLSKQEDTFNAEEETCPMTSGLFMNEIGFFWLTFSAPNIITSLGIEIQTGNCFDFGVLWSKIVLYSSLLIALLGNLTAFCSAEDSLDVGPYWKKDSKSGLWAPVLFVLRLYTTAALLFVDAYPETTYVAFVLQSIYILFVIFGRPHNFGFDTFRSVTIELSILFVLSSRFSMAHIFPSFMQVDDIAYQIFAIVEVSLYCTVLVFSVISGIMQVHNSCSKKKKVKQIYPAESFVERISKDSQKLSETSPSKREMMRGTGTKTDAIISVESMEGSFVPPESDNRIDLPRSFSKRISYESILETSLVPQRQEPGQPIQESKVIDWDRYKARRINRFRAGKKP